MRYWWVNQKQTYRHEVPGGYLWSPKRKADGQRNPYYDFMREVAPGDVIFSFADAQVRAIGLARSHAYEAPKPLEFGQAGAYWDNIGWRVDVGFVQLRLPLRPSNEMAILAPLLPTKYAPLLASGRGLQNLYLTHLPELFAAALIDLIGAEARDVVLLRLAAQHLPQVPAVGLEAWEEHELEQVRSDAELRPTVRESIVMARRGQGLFKERVLAFEKACRLTGVDRVEHLRASHCKPWRDATNSERLDGENGLLLTPNADHLFDRGFLSFDDDGDVLISPVAHGDSLSRLGVDPARPGNVGGFRERQAQFLKYHREFVFLRSRYLETARS